MTPQAAPFLASVDGHETRMDTGEKSMVRPERFELPTFWFVARRWMILYIFVENKGEGFDYRTSQRFATVWLHPAGYEWGCQQGSVVRPR
jgi:hypothetical protein